MEPLEAGRAIGAKYRLVRRLGRGSMGEVWLAEHQTLREEVAIKLLTRPPWREDIEDASNAAARFCFEAQVAARLSRKTRHIVRVTDHGEDGGVAYLVMELLDGMTLESVFMRRGCMDVGTASNMVTQLGRALECAHGEGVLHRDLKPANVFLTRDEDGAVLLKVFDFGIACLLRPHRTMTTFLTADGVLLGTPGYLSPEQARGRASVDFQCDLWALATIAYEALSGELPVEGASSSELLKNLCAGRLVPLRERSPELSPALDTFFRRAFAERVEDRYASVAELTQAFERAASAGTRVVCASGSASAVCDEEATHVSPVTRSIAAPIRRIDRRRVAVATTIFAATLGAVAAITALEQESLEWNIQKTDATHAKTRATAWERFIQSTVALGPKAATHLPNQHSDVQVSSASK